MIIKIDLNDGIFVERNSGLAEVYSIKDLVNVISTIPNGYRDAFSFRIH